jgi:release factor glutamine methyltransferase
MAAAIIAEMLRPQHVAPLDARVLLRTVLGVSDAYIAAHPEQRLTNEQRGRFEALLRRRRAGEPIAYLIGEREFYSLPFHVTPAVLIPRPESEMLVDLVLERAPPGRSFDVLDLATGSGCIAVAIAKNCPRARVTASDVSRAALVLAQKNAARHSVAVELIESDWFEALAGRRFEMIVVNPPYVATDDPHLAQGDARFEPRDALVAGRTGYECIDVIAANAMPHLIQGGSLIFEHGHEQGAHCRGLLGRLGYKGVSGRHDIAGHDRAAIGERP